MKSPLILAFTLSTSFAYLPSHAQQMGYLGANFAAPTINGKVNVYSPVTGEIIYDSSDSTFYGRTSSAWVAFSGASGASVPEGTVIAYAGTVCPTGYLTADGAAVSRTTYATLFTAIGSAHGSGNGSTTFNLPDYRGRFLRGVDGTAGNDPDSATRTAMNASGNTGNSVGSVQSDQLKSHTHTEHPGTSSGQVGTGGAFTVPTDASGTQTTGATGGTETRPKNAYVNYCIKY